MQREPCCEIFVYKVGRLHRSQTRGNLRRFFNRSIGVGQEKQFDENFSRYLCCDVEEC